MPPEIEWFANISSAATKRSYEHAIRDFMQFTGIERSEEFRTVTRAHVIAWRDDLLARTPKLEGSSVRHRLPMHPADQFEAFKGLADSGKGPEDIAARFGCSPAIVRQRLKLASVSPALLDVYRAEDMTLDQLMAFTVSDDHEAQEKLWCGSV